MKHLFKRKSVGDGVKTKDFGLSVKSVSPEGVFDGYGSVFLNTDSAGEKVMPGAFAESLARHKREGTSPLMLWQHDPWSPIGVWDDLAEDGKGLRVVGRLIDGVQKADEAKILLKAGAIRGLSIGYREIEVEPDGNNRLLKKLDLLEISVVSMPANRRAVVENVKAERAEEFRARIAAGDMPAPRDFEAFLREAGGFSKSMATAIASVGYAKAVRSDSDAREANNQADEFLRELSRAFG